MVAHAFKGILLYTFSLMALGCNGRSPGDPSVTEKSAPDNSILRDLQSVKERLGRSGASRGAASIAKDMMDLEAQSD